MPAGVFRNVFLTKRHAIKVPRLRHLSGGMRCNRWEREMWSKWRQIFGWENLCPVVIADPFGFFVVMPRAEQPVTFSDVVAATSGEYDYYPDITAETKAEDFGRLGDRVVALDYGLPDSGMVSDRRAYYESKSSPRAT